MCLLADGGACLGSAVAAVQLSSGEPHLLVVGTVSGSLLVYNVSAALRSEAPVLTAWYRVLSSRARPGCAKTLAQYRAYVPVTYSGKARYARLVGAVASHLWLICALGSCGDHSGGGGSRV